MALESCRRPIEPAKFVLKEKRSEFIATLLPARTSDEARAALDAVRREYYSATHNCPAWRVGFPDVEEFSSDDGEPGGTAGRPILGELQKNGVADALLVVTRYFGGVKLGVRGLIDAYGAAAVGVLAQARLETALPFRELTLRCGYDNLGTIQRLLKNAGVPEYRITPNYGAEAEMKVLVNLNAETKLREQLEKYEITQLLLEPARWAERLISAAAKTDEMKN